MQFIDRYLTPLGSVTMASDGRSLTGLWFDGQKYYADTLHGEYVEKETDVFRQTKNWLDIYFSGKAPGFIPPLVLSGSPFRMRVWEILKSISFGKTVTYGGISKILEKETGDRVSAQAVGGAVGHNPISIIVPCHRVIGADGSLTGYAGGIDKKTELLRIEGVDISKLKNPQKGTAL